MRPMATRVFPEATRPSSHGKTLLSQGSPGMVTPRPHLLAALILSLVACSTQHLDGNDYYRPFTALTDDLVSLGGSMPPGMGRLRYKTDDKFLVCDTGDGTYVYSTAPERPHEFSQVPARIPYDLVNDAGQDVLHVEPTMPPNA